MIAKIMTIAINAAVQILSSQKDLRQPAVLTGPRLPCTADDACKKQLPSEDMMQPLILH